MGNVLSEAKRQQVIALGRLGWSLRRIEQETGVRRETAGGWKRKPWPKPAMQVTTDCGSSTVPVDESRRTSAGVRAVSAQRLGSCPPQTHTPVESARIAPPWLSSPTLASRPKLTLKSRVEVCCAEGGPKQTAEVDHFRMPKSFNPRARTGRDKPIQRLIPSYTCFNPRARTGRDSKYPGVALTI